MDRRDTITANDTVEIPRPQEIDADWVARALDGQVRPARVTVTPVGTGQLGETYRIGLDYDGGATGPASLIIKLAAADETSRETARAWQLYEREVRFYRELAPRAGIDTPHAYATGLAEDGRFFLLLEDLAPASAGDQIAGIADEDAHRAMREAARLHAAFWAQGEDPALGWLETGKQAQAFYGPTIFRSVWPGFRERYADMLHPDHVAVCDAFSELYDSYSSPLDRPRCVAHNDFRPDNMLFGKGADRRLTVVDWQSAGLGFNAVDVSYMIGGAFEPAARTEIEDALLETYHAEIVRQGVTTYTMADLREDYRHFTFAGINVAVGAAMLVKRTERGDRLFLTMLDRHVRHVLDTDALALLRERN